MQSIRERTLEAEKKFISPYGMLCENSRGRELPEEECPVRTA